jgi:CRP/FNR family transcriptional regulator, cyclic AMP receptor protein
VPPAPTLTARRVRLLEVDPDLGSELTAEEFEQAMNYAVVEVDSLDPGVHDPARIGDPSLLGLLVIDGLLVRCVQVAERRCGELVGRGGILRPWDNFGEYAPMPFEVSWRVIEPVQLALLDIHLVRLGVRWPQLVHGILRRAVERSHGLALDVAIHSLRHIELRLLVLFWHLADRFGRVTSEGTIVPLPLSHANI